MPKLLILIFLATLLLSCKTSIETFQTNDKDKIGVKSNKFRGTIFKSTYQKDKVYIAVTDSIKTFTPSIQDVTLAESILKEQIENANRSHINQLEKRQYIDRNMNKYFRQYIGFINNKDERIVHINFHWDRFTLMDRIKGYWDDRLDYTSDFSLVLDGGSRYWKVNVNLTTKTLYGLSVNGLAFQKTDHKIQFAPIIVTIL